MTPPAQSPATRGRPESERTGKAVHFDAGHFLPDPEAARLLPRGAAMRYMTLPLAADATAIRVAMKDPSDLEALDYVEMVTGRRPVGIAADEEQLRELVRRIYGSSLAGPEDLAATVAEAVQLARDAPDRTELPIVRLADQILAEAVGMGATDIHIQPEEAETIVRVRVDGMLRPMTSLPALVHIPLLTRFKIMADLDISERRLPQDGEIQLMLGERKIDLRVSTLPTIFGENLVLRVLDHSRVLLGLEDLGYRAEDREVLERLFRRPNGMVLVTGPTGSGKSTTLYAALRSIDSQSCNIMTLEDPVEYQIKGIRQSQISEKSGFTFAAGLRSILRQDPDVILVGEMRDLETTEVALRAALTGHLVFSTLHTTSAVGSVARLREMGIQDYLLAATLAGILAQRLVRRLCPHCSEPAEASAAEKQFLGLSPDEPASLRRARSCPGCHDTGYKGRFAVYELLQVTPEVSDAIARAATPTELADLALRCGFAPMRRCAASRVLEGWTTVEEIARALV